MFRKSSVFAVLTQSSHEQNGSWWHYRRRQLASYEECSGITSRAISRATDDYRRFKRPLKGSFSSDFFATHGNFMRES